MNDLEEVSLPARKKRRGKVEVEYEHEIDTRL